MVNSTQEQSQLDRIEAKLDRLTGIVDAALQLAMPRVPAKLREAAVKALAKGSGR